MEISIRIVNIVWGLAFIEGTSCVTAAFKRRLLLSIWQHGQYLVRHLETAFAPMGQSATITIIFPISSGSSIGFAVAGVQGSRNMAANRRTRSRGRNGAPGLCRWRRLQFLRFVPPPRDQLFTSAALLCRLNGVDSERFWQRLEKMYAISLYVMRPDGKAPQIGDADDGRLHILSEYGRWIGQTIGICFIGAALFSRPDMKAAAGTFSEEAYWLLGSDGARRFDALEDSAPALASKAFQDAGFYVMRSAKNYVIACCNPVGTAGTGNHKHNDLLSFELFMGGLAFIVNPGTYVYTAIRSGATGSGQPPFIIRLS